MRPAGLADAVTGAEPTAILKKQPVYTDTDQGIRFFTDACTRRNVKGEAMVRGTSLLHTENPVKEVVRESRFADLLLVDADTSFAGKTEVVSHFVKDVMTLAECPVIVAPAYFESIDEVAFCYDSEHSSVFAMKQFTYLFPQLAEKKLTVLEVNRTEDMIVEKEKVQSWLTGYYPHINFQVLNGEPAEELMKYFLLKKNMLLVMGAYGRSMVSSMLKKSNADLLMRVVDLPVFITHHT